MTLTNLFYKLLFGKLYFCFAEEEDKPAEDGNNEEGGIDVSYLQSQLDAAITERDKFKNDYLSTKKRAEKAEKKAKTTVPPEEVDTLKQQLEITKEQLTEREQKLKQLETAQLKAEMVQAVNARTPELADGVAGILPDIMSSRMGVIDGQAVVLTEVGTPKLSAKTGKPMTAQELIDEILAKTPAFLKAKAGGGNGANGNDGAGGLAITKEDYMKKSSAERAEIRAKLTPEQLQTLLN